jgi:hypothetical protein
LLEASERDDILDRFDGIDTAPPEVEPDMERTSFLKDVH